MGRFLLFLLASIAYAQTYEIRGMVAEVGGAGIPDAEVSIQMIGAANQTMKTDGRGNFRITVDKPGTYFVINPTKPGYFTAGFPRQPVVVDAGRPQADVTLTLVRAGEVNGRVLDDSTREPASGVEVTLFSKRWNYGQLNLTLAVRDPAVTDAEGRFRFPNLPPGEYIASARPQPLRSGRVLEEFTKADADVIEEAYPPTYWPGGADAASSFGVVLTSGGYADIGTMFVHKAPQYRVRARMQGGCAEGDDVRMWILKRDGGRALDVGSFSCTGELLVRGFDPGSYILYVSSDRQNGQNPLETTVSGIASIEVIDKNLSVAIPLQRDIIIEGQLSIADGVPALRIVPRIGTKPFDLLAGAQMESDTLIRWAPDQRHFQLAVSPRVQNLIISDPIGAYVKEIRYNGAPLRGSILPVNSSAASHKLEIVIDDKYGSLTGSVVNAGRPVPDARVLIVKDSLRMEDLAAEPFSTRSTGPDGTLSTTQLAPGDYRLIAFLPAEQQKIQEAGILPRLLSSAQRVTVIPGATQTVTIRLSDVR